MRTQIVILALVGFLPLATAQDPAAPVMSGDQAYIVHQIEIYMRSIDAADPGMGAQVWLTTPEATFIHPLGEEKGWDQIQDDVYRKLMGQTFITRKLMLAGTPAIQVFGDSAVAEFHWDFHALLRSNDKSVHTTGRESQVYVRLPGQGWKLVHVHYSGPPIQMPSNGNF